MGGKGSGSKKIVDYAPQNVKKPEGKNRQNLLLALEAWDLPRVDTKNPAAIEERIEMYLRHCAENDVAPSVSGCAAWMGVHNTLLLDYYQGKRGTPAHQMVAAKFYNVVQNVWAMDMHEGNINPVSGIFMGKAFFGLKDTQEVVISNGNASQDRLSTDDLIAESKRLPGAETLALPEGTQTVEDVVVDEDRYLRSVERQKRMQERKERAEKNQPIRKQKKKEYLKQYYIDHKEHMDETRRKNHRKAAERAREEAERQKEQKKPDSE